MNMINCLCHLISIDTFAALTDKLLLHERIHALSSSWLSKFLLIKFKEHYSYGRRYCNDNYSVLEFWPILSGNVNVSRVLESACVLLLYS